MTLRVGLIGMGAMGAAVAERLSSRGAEVVASLSGRSEASRARARAAGVVEVDEAGLGKTDLVLSIVPPSEALPSAQRYAAALAGGRAVYVDCNAVSPARAAQIEAAIAGAGRGFVDGGILGAPPRAGTPGATFFFAGPHATSAARLADYGLVVRTLDKPNGAASALKMSYAGITKGLIALAAAMALAAREGGVADDLVAELGRSQPNLLASFSKSVPDMLGKAGRWVPEMEEIASFIGPDMPAGEIYRSFADFYEYVASHVDEHEALRHFYLPADSNGGA